MTRICKAVCVLMTAAFFFSIQAGDGRIEVPDGLVVQPHAYAHLEGGQVVNGTLNQDAANKYNGGAENFKIDHVWTEDAYISLGMDAIYMNRLRLQFFIDTKLYFSYPILNDARYTKNMRQDVGIGDASAKYFLGGADSTFLVQVGWFQYKYNPDVRNLGEYLFRTGTYPIYYEMGFDFPQTRLLGLRSATHLLNNSLKIDALLTSAVVYPAMNWSLSALADYDIAAMHFIDLGLGVDFADLFDVYTGHSFPLFGGDPTTPTSVSINSRYVSGSDTLWYTFKGTKVMGRLSINPQSLLKLDFLKEDDLKLYAEADIIGLQNYPDIGLDAANQVALIAPSYNELDQKMPIVLGINIPTFKILDILNFEFEFASTKYYNDASYLINKGSAPLPYDVLNQATDPLAPKKSNIKWSFYAKRSFCNGHLAITGQIARDHMRLPCAAYDFEMYNELLVEDRDWWWALKTSWMF